MDFIGKLHPLLLHLPIGILVYAFLHWVYELFFQKKDQQTDFTFALSIGALSAIASALSGWLLAQNGGYDEQLLSWHQYLGIAAAVGSVFLLWLYKKEIRSNTFTIYFGVFIILLSLTGHYGGSLTHGEGFLTTKTQTSSISLDNPQEAHIFNDIVMPIFEKKCVSCHNPQKSKGDLLLHNLEGWLKGGENGAVIQLGMASESAIINRIFLPKEDDDHMPPSGKLQISIEERNFLKWWVNNMQNYEHKIKDLASTEAVEEYIKILQAVHEPKVDKPSPKRLATLEKHGLIVSFQSSDAPWVDVRLAKADSYDTKNLRYLKKIAPAIKSIDLSNSLIADNDTKILSRFENLENINLSNCKISSEAISSFKDLPLLKVLNLYGSLVDSTVFHELESIPKLQKVYIWETQITARQVEQWRLRHPTIEIIEGVDFAIFGSPILVAPLISADQDLFTDSLLVTLDTKANRATIKYTLDGSVPTINSPNYTEPFFVHQTTEVKCILTMDGWTDSEVASRTFAKSRHPIAQLKLSVNPNEKYAGEGSKTLIDLKKGTSTFGDGHWLGFHGDDVLITADLGEVKEVTGITIGTLSDFISYIHLPVSISVQISGDGRRYVPYQEKQIPIEEGPTEAKVYNHFLSAAPIEARYLRIKLNNRKVNPPWHAAPGATCWLFIDEILVE